MDLDDELCLCFHVTKRKIVNFVRQTKPRLPSQISECFGAGTGCGWCIPFLLKIHQQARSGLEATDELSAEEYAARRQGYRQSVAQGERAKNAFASKAPDQVGGVEAPPPARGAGEAAPESLDYTRYFSRSRPDPEPETLSPDPPPAD